MRECGGNFVLLRSVNKTANNDRAKYGDRLLKRLAEKVNKRGINETILYSCRKFYLIYPQIYSYLTGNIYATASHKSVISPTASEKLEISPTMSDKSVEKNP